MSPCSSGSIRKDEREDLQESINGNVLTSLYLAQKMDDDMCFLPSGAHSPHGLQ